MKVCFIGACGHWNQAYNYLKTRQDIAFCGFAPGSIDEDNLFTDDTVPFYADYKKMLDEIKPDLVVISPVFGITGQIIIECANRGIDIFSEKPVAYDLDELKAVSTAISKNKIRFCAMHYLRYAPAFYHGTELVRSGEIGKLKMITAQKSYKYGTRPDWYKNPRLYGGTIPWIGIHAIDWIYCFSGKKFTSVSAHSLGESPEMAALCQFTLEDDIIAAANIDYYRPQTAWTHDDDRIRCVGTEGVLEISRGKIFLTNKKGVFEITPDPAPELLEEFLDNKNPISTGEIIHITEVALSAKQSAISGKTIKIGG